VSVTAAGVSAAGVAGLVIPVLAELTNRNMLSLSRRDRQVPILSISSLTSASATGNFKNSGVASSRLIPHEAVTDPVRNAAVTEAIGDVVQDGSFSFLFLIVGMNVSINTAPDIAVLPAWRQAAMHAIYASS
jgi:hypothetical protein